MGTRIGRAYRLTRSVFALLTKDGSELQPDVGKFPFPMALKAHPVHRTSALRFGRTNRRNVVFRMARDNAGLATRTSIQINSHPPTMWHACLLNGVSLLPLLLFRSKTGSIGSYR